MPEGSQEAKSSAGSMAGGMQQFLSWLDSPIPVEFLNDPENTRRARLISRFGLLGSLFGIVYATFYMLISHKWGTVIILMCSLCFAATPFLMRWRKSVELPGHLLTFTLVCGFTALCFVEGGLKGHAIAWLVSIPLFALLLLGQKAATRWAIVAFLAAGVVAAFDLAGKDLPVTYDMKWNPIVSATGYLGLVTFMFILGSIFETGRRRAFAKMQEAVAELATSNERLVHLNNEKNEFLGIAAHDLKNPLTVILGSAEVAGMVRDQNQVNKMLANISGAATRMRELITNLLDVNAIEQGKFTSKIEPCDLRSLVRQSVDGNLPSSTKKNIEIRVGASEGLWAKADPAATLQILDNLISNAVKYSPLGTTVQVHAIPERNHVLVAVRDEGPGISEDDQKKMFQKFTRLTARPTGGESSTGLGLAIVKRLAEAMAGSVQCHSTLGAGSTFTLRLPVCPAPVAVPAPTPAAAITPASVPVPEPTMPARSIVPDPLRPTVHRN